MRLTYLLLFFSLLLFQCDLADRVNALDEGVVKCTAGAKICRGNQVLQCNANGQGQTILEVCQEGYTCESGACTATMDAGTDAGGPAVLTLEPASHDFGEVFVGDRATQSFIVKNSGGSIATAVSINPMLDEVFSVEVENTTCTSPTLALNSSCIITMSFHPTTEGPASASLTLTYHSGVAEETITGELSGTGKTGVLLTIAGDGDFGEQPIHGQLTRVFTVTQAGTAAASNLSVQGLTAPFSVATTDCQTTLSGSCTITVQFNPENKDEVADTLEVFYHNGEAITSAAKELSGQGVAPYGWIGKTISNQLVHPWSSDPVSPQNKVKSGKEPGAFALIFGLTVDPAGNIYAAEQGNCRVQRLDSNGNPTGWIGSNGSVNTGWQMGSDPKCPTPISKSFSYSSATVFGFGEPNAITQANGMLFILDKTDDPVSPTQIQQWDLQTGSRVAFHNLSPGSYYMFMALSPSNYFYLSESGNHRIERWHFNGSGLEYAGFIGGIPSYHNTSDWRAAYNGTEYQDTPLASERAGAFYQPKDLVIDGQGVVYIVDQYLNRVTRLWANGSFAGSICGGSGGWNWESCNGSGSGSAPGYFKQPWALTLSNASLLVVDTNNNRIQRFNGATGQYWGEFGSYGTEDEKFQYPRGIAADENGSLYIADTSSHRIQKWMYNGTNDNFDYIGWIGHNGSGDYHRNFIPGGIGTGTPTDDFYNKSGFQYPTGVAVDEEYLYVVDEAKRSVQRFWLTDPAQVDQLILTEDTDTPGPQKIEVTSSALYVTAWSWSETPGMVYVINPQSFSVSRVFDPAIIFGQVPVGQRVFSPHSVRVYNGLCYLTEYFSGSREHARISRASLDLNTLIDWAGFYLHMVPTQGWTMEGDTAWDDLPGVFNMPSGLAVDPTAGMLFVADYMNNRVQQFLLDGTFYFQAEVPDPLSIALADNAIFVAYGVVVEEFLDLSLFSIRQYDPNFFPLGKILFDMSNNFIPFVGMAVSGNYLLFSSSSTSIFDLAEGINDIGTRLFRWHQAAIPNWD